MHIILTITNTSTNCKQIDDAILLLTDEYGEFEACERVASIDGGVIIHILDAPNALLYQDDVAEIVKDVCPAANILVCD